MSMFLILLFVLLGLGVLYLIVMLILSFIWVRTPFRPCKRWCHGKAGWHEPDESENVTYDGEYVHSKCRFCGKHIIRSRKGTWGVHKKLHK